ncbi:MFS transporter [Pseudorhodoferax sp. Leaf274]|uniref:MFS transporter n=1 Tax=Pseudorhodoferax sp. Leaf274 TaxID=1736318 RepID=UPI00070374D7|nr:MFS transporter [Pseudorhodoferax sp. Leaf274]KQP44645.1 MFS transporter [Pseudorhodoferax sp. Leaf274]
MSTTALPPLDATPPTRSETTPRATDTPQATGVPRRIVAATVAGNALEFYDFVTYAFFAVYIGRAFFPASTPLASLLLSVAVFGVGFVTRPLGGVLIGMFADRAGRKPAMLLTIALITVGTLGLALTPSYAQIGMAAPLIVVFCRLVQGIALGGEVGPATAFLVEAAPPGRRAFYSGWQLASQGIATLVAGLIGMAVIATLTPEQLQHWGWRLPFLLSLLLVPLAVYLRREMPETLHATGGMREHAGFATLARHRRTIGLAVLVILGGTVSNYVGNYMTTYAMATLKFAPLVAMGATVMMGVATFGFALLGGWLADRHGRKPVMLWPRLATALLVVPAFLWLIDQPSLPVLLAVTLVISALGAMSGGASITAIPELLPRGIRASGLSIAYAVGVSLFGGTTQFVVTWLIEATGNKAAPAWYVAITSLVTAAAMLAMPESRDRNIDG